MRLDIYRLGAKHLAEKDTRLQCNSQMEISAEIVSLEQENQYGTS